jgi:cell division protein DivIC
LKRQQDSKIKILNNSYFEQQHQQAQLHAGKLHTKRVHHRRMVVIIGFFVICCLFLGGQVLRTQHLTSGLLQQRRVADDKLTKVKQQRSDLKQQTRQLQDDDYLQKLIREKYYYSKNGETIYNLPSSNKNGEQNK